MVLNPSTLNDDFTADIAPHILTVFALCDGGRESVAQDKIKEAHRRVMTANHPDAGGSDYLAAKINEAKDHLRGQTRGSASAF
ncbi:hypothetical protein Mp_6g04850 [Marchantia polymorpha subsp. ruderalis]|uniref:J domain-containing protein n=2 Tax=Marchantia polymorpha TaxID=3197 RepID=A0AAF6BNL1_MARPO|nr:hypothetical protein MARPO_0034s0032 [Marchantia polymorpha]BBN13595.1 hypothetical protein Mp_6g04850 [Marchantia polymorpha subsp. ruderalis]|eukprot:PTQ41435.1 hypothetical protein MARPO_0034s0032 [Marchantia polymorpha]